MNEHELELHCVLFGCPIVVVNGARIVLCVYTVTVHACSFNYKLDYDYSSLCFCHLVGNKNKNKPFIHHLPIENINVVEH